MAEAYFGVPGWMKAECEARLPGELLGILCDAQNIINKNNRREKYGLFGLHGRAAFLGSGTGPVGGKDE